MKYEDAYKWSVPLHFVNANGLFVNRYKLSWYLYLSQTSPLLLVLLTIPETAGTSNASIRQHQYFQQVSTSITNLLVVAIINYTTRITETSLSTT